MLRWISFYLISYLGLLTFLVYDKSDAACVVGLEAFLINFLRNHLLERLVFVFVLCVSLSHVPSSLPHVIFSTIQIVGRGIQKVGSLTPPSSPKMAPKSCHRRILSDVTHSTVFGVPVSKSTQLLQAAAAEASLNKSK